MVDLSMSQARRRLGSLVRRAVSDHERVTITDRGQPAAVLVNAEELADLEEALALAEYRAGQASGQQQLISHEEALQRLGLQKPGPSAAGSSPPAA
jgi:prevent-host-death family protein